jgi:hypothetical protein
LAGAIDVVDGGGGVGDGATDTRTLYGGFDPLTTSAWL